jgi:hypothetical protein
MEKGNYLRLRARNSKQLGKEAYVCVHEIGFYLFVHWEDLLHDVRPQGRLARPFQVSDDLPDQVELYAARLSRRGEMGGLQVRQR